MLRVTILLCLLAAGSTLEAQTATDLVADGRRHMTAGRMADALQAFEAAVKADSANASTWRALANALHRLERYPDALAALDRASAISPKDFAVRFNRALTLSELGRVAAAATELDTAIALRADFAPAWTERGAARALLGHTADARADWQKALELNPNYVWSRFYRALASITDGDYRAAAADLDSVTAKESLLSAHLWRWVAYRLDGRPAPPLPAHGTEWPGPIAAFLEGGLTASQLLAAATPSRPALDQRRLASAHFFIGQRFLAEGSADEARASFARATQAAAPRHAEVVAADAFLRRLAGQPNVRR